jgi:mannose-6-phosphate isomerase-like protein (cupin superfamily)
MDAFRADELERRRAGSGERYLEFLRRDSMSLGLYTLEAGAQDTQTPHAEDEAYVVVAGRGQIMVDGESTEVGPGSVVFVAATVDHRFHSITEKLEILVVFAPPESGS